MKAPSFARHAHAATDVHPELPIAGPRRYPHWLNRERVRLYATAALMAELLFIGIYSIRVLLSHHGAPEPLSPDFSPIWSAAWLAAQDDLENTVIVAGDAILDAALARHGLPVSSRFRR